MNYRPNKWPDERKQLLADMWAAGKTSGECAAALGITRSAAMGQIFRMETLSGKRLRASAPPRPFKPPGPAKPRVRRRPSLARRTAGMAPVQTIEFMGVLAMNNRPSNWTLCDDSRVGILDVTGCKWPVGYSHDIPGRHTFCNGERDGDSPYCAAHRAFGTRVITYSLERKR